MGLLGEYSVGDYIVGLDGVKLVGLIVGLIRERDYYYHIQFNYDGITYTYPYRLGDEIKVQDKWVRVNSQRFGGGGVSLTVKD